MPARMTSSQSPSSGRVNDLRFGRPIEEHGLDGAMRDHIPKHHALRSCLQSVFVDQSSMPRDAETYRFNSPWGPVGSSWRKEGDASGGGVCEKVCALWGTARNCMAAHLPASRSIFRGAAICCDFLFQQLVLVLCVLLILHLAFLHVPDVLRRE